jgi:hypothetical protein
MKHRAEAVPPWRPAIQFQGPISLDKALFCVGCEVIFTGASLCPRCTGEAVWPLAEWFHPTGSSPAVPQSLERHGPSAPPAGRGEAADLKQRSA